MCEKIICIAILIFFSCTDRKKIVSNGDTVILAYKIKNESMCRIDESFLHQDWNNLNDQDLFKFRVGRNEVIAGWDSVIVGCKKNKIYNFRIPYQKAYGKENIYHDIPPKSDLWLSFKIIDIL